MPRRDKKRLEYFFKHAILHNDYGYTLLGDKPVSLCAYRKISFSSDVMNNYSVLLPHNIRMGLGWKTWKKHAHHFNLKHFALWEEESPWIHNGVVIVLANQEKVNQTYEMFKEDFQRFGKGIDLKRVTIEPLLKEQLRSHEGLIGTILGYGRDNAWLYASRKGYSMSEALWEDEIEKQLLKQFQGKTLAEKLGYPQFIADVDSMETRRLKEKYKKARKVILQTYEGKDFLETTLNLLTVF
ncbi:MAG: hypothetical protein H7A38_02765 [Chlamydiales bacterium]|nr:hypothetical protein [Chlamydiales bacterium]